MKKKIKQTMGELGLWRARYNINLLSRRACVQATSSTVVELCHVALCSVDELEPRSQQTLCGAVAPVHCLRTEI